MISRNVLSDMISRASRELKKNERKKQTNIHFTHRRRLNARGRITYVNSGELIHSGLYKTALGKCVCVRARIKFSGRRPIHVYADVYNGKTSRMSFRTIVTDALWKSQEINLFRRKLLLTVRRAYEHSARTESDVYINCESPRIYHGVRFFLLLFSSASCNFRRTNIYRKEKALLISTIVYVDILKVFDFQSP